MKRRLTVFDLARMRHLDLLAVWWRLHPDSHDRDPAIIGRLSIENLAATILRDAPVTRHGPG